MISTAGLLQILSAAPLAAEPRLWVRRLVIYETIASASSPVVIRETLLHRGLNIIQGADTVGPSPGISGHSVGKTTFCRLIRYILGESRCGSKRTQERLQVCFPYGYVGAEVLLDGRLWSVLRPFNPDRAHYIGDGMGLESLVSGRQSTLSVNQWRDHLAEQLTEGIGGYNMGEPLLNRWLKLLAWCSRDQEAGLRELHTWRSPRSESESPAFSQSRQGPLRLMRGVFGLFTEDSEQLDAKLAEVTKDFIRAEADAAEARKEPEYWLRRQEAWLEDRISRGAVDRETVETFGLAGAFQALINTRIADLEKLIRKREEAQDKVDHLGARLKEAQSTLSQLKAGISVLEPVTADLRSDLASEEPEPDELEKLLRQIRGFCSPGNVRISDCSIVRSRQNALQAERIANARIIPIGQDNEPIVTQVILEERDQTAQQHRNQAEALYVQILEFEKKLRFAKDELTRASNEVVEAQLELRDTERRHAEFEDAQRLTNDPSANRPLQNALRQQVELQAEKTTLTNHRHKLLAEHKQRLNRMRALYNALVVEVLSTGYEGVVSLTTDDFAFSIAEQSDIGGEAVDTLAVVLADVTALLASVAGMASHPRFLIHDSPREADLQQSIYSRYFQILLRLHDHLGGDKAAPFQYIVTTTTPPPKTVHKVVRLHLQAHPEQAKLLKRNLFSSTPPDQLPGI